MGESEMTPEIEAKLRELEELEKKATPAGWERGKEGAIVTQKPDKQVLIRCENTFDAYGGHVVCETITPGNMAFVVALRNAFPMLATVLRNLSLNHYRLHDALLSIEEYWNGSPDSAVDAAEEMRDRARKALDGDILPGRPKIVTLCGSTRFIAEMAVIAWTMEKEGAIVLGLHLLPESYTQQRDHQAEFEGIKERMDALHLSKIEISDEILVVNIGGYIGESTKSEIQHARRLGKVIKYWEE